MADEKMDEVFVNPEARIYAVVSEKVFSEGYFVGLYEVVFDHPNFEDGYVFANLETNVDTYQRAQDLMHVFAPTWKPVIDSDVAHFEIVREWLVP